jgi:hypothetical protein
MESVGFKEWALVCEALGAGRQSIILRKGGIAEGREGFSFKHREFFLFPTWFHEQPEKVTWHGPPSQYPLVSDLRTNASDRQGMPMPHIEIKFAAQIELSRTVNSWPIAEALEPLHILRPEVVRERFYYDEAPGLHIALVRIFRLFAVWKFPEEKKYGGCRSWVKLPEAPDNLQLEAVLSDAENLRRREQFLKIVGGAAKVDRLLRRRGQWSSPLGSS